jgi:Flp pilus assembly protein TadG
MFVSDLLSRMQRLCRDQSANVGLTFGIAFLPIVCVVGSAVDFSRASNVRTMLHAAADAAAIGAIVPNSAAYKAALAMDRDGQISIGATEAIRIFNANIADKSGFVVTGVTATVSRAAGTLTAAVSFTATVQSAFMQVLGTQSVAVANSATATNEMATYIDFHLLLDNTPSMGLAATPADISTLVNATTKYGETGGRGCAFACHQISPTFSTPGGARWNNYYVDAKNLGIRKRIDVVAQAAAEVMDTVGRLRTVQDQFRVATYSFGSWGSTGPSDVGKMVANGYAPHVVTALTSDLARAKQQAAAVDLMTVDGIDENGETDTNYDMLLPAMSALIADPGDGNARAPQKWLFLVTDGMTDLTRAGSRVLGPIDTNLCRAIKQRGIGLAVLHTTYWPLPASGIGSDPWTTSNVLSMLSPNDTLAPAMRACASPGFYWAVSPGGGIGSAFGEMFRKVVKQAQVRLTH